ILSGAFQPQDITRDGSRPLAGATPSHPGVVISFEAFIDGKHVPLKYPCDTFTDWQDNVRAMTAEQASSYVCTASGIPCNGAKILDRDSFTERYRAAAKRFHPDANGGT